jgi:hypothetical protein
MGLQLIVLLLVVGIAVGAHAGSNVTVGVTLTGAGGAEYGFGPNVADGEYLMPYYLSVNNGNPVAVICDDYNHSVSLGEQWTATVNNFSNLSDTRFGTADSMQYHEAVWIASQISSTSSLAQIASAQYAIWALFAPNTPMIPGESMWISLASTAAANNYYGMNFANWEVLTPLNPSSPQEYLLYDPLPLPEPAAILDFMVALILLAGGLYLRRARQPQLARVRVSERFSSRTGLPR